MQLTRHKVLRDLFPFAKEKVSVSTLAVTLSSTFTNVCVEAFLRFEGGDMRVWRTGAVPTSTDGHLQLEGDTLLLSRSEAKLFQAIRSGSNDGTIWVVYYN